MSEIEQTRSVQELRTRMNDGLDAFLAELDQLTGEQMLGSYDDVGWNVRDHLVHLAVWAEGIAALLRREDRWAAMGLPTQPPEDQEHWCDQINEQIANQHRERLPADARAWLLAAHSRVATAVEALSDDALSEPYDRYIAPFTGQSGDPIIRYIIDNTYGHYAEHLPWIQAIAHPEDR